MEKQTKKKKSYSCYPPHAILFLQNRPHEHHNGHDSSVDEYRDKPAFKI